MGCLGQDKAPSREHPEGEPFPEHGPKDSALPLPPPYPAHPCFCRGASVPGTWTLPLPAAGSDVCNGADSPAGMFSPREALAGGRAFLGIVSGREGGLLFELRVCECAVR